MHVHVESILECPAEAVWKEVCRSGTLSEVAWPVVTFRAVDAASLPGIWIEGQTVRVRSRLFGILPVGTRSLFFERINAERREIQTRERDLLIQRWDHLISVRQHGENGTRYSDNVEIDARWGMTPLVWLFAQLFYHHRHRRWRRLARRLASSSDTVNP